MEEFLDRKRVLTLTGPGGAGKTRLALEVALRLRDRYSHGVWLVELASLASGDLVAGAVASRVGAVQATSRPVVDEVADRFSDGRALLILDNCERVVESCAAIVDALTQRCPGLSVLATSRAPLRISGEAVVALPPLALEEEAVHLFADRAAAARGGFTVTDQNRAAVIDVCRRLDCLPLAIELAATLAAVMPPAELARELDHRFEILDAGPRDLDERQRSLRASVEWSYDLLAAQERWLFRRLAVFEQPFSLPEVRAIASDAADSTTTALRLVSHLVEKSMITATADSSERAQYRLLGTLREFALEQLRAAGEEHQVRDRHLAHFLALAEAADREYLATGSTQPVQRLAECADEMRAALAWASRSDPSAHVRLAGALDPYWRFFAMQEGAERLRSAVMTPGPPTEYRARALLAAGTLAGYLHDTEQAARLLTESLAVAQQIGDPTSAAWAELELGSTAWIRMDFEESRRRLSSSLEAMKALSSAFGEERAALHLGTTLIWLDEPARGRKLLADASSTARALGDAWGEGLAEAMSGWAEIASGRFGEAERHLRAALDFEILGPMRAAAIEGLAQTATARRDTDRALVLLGSARRLLAEFGTRCAPPIASRSNALEAKLRESVGARQAAARLAQGGSFTPDEGVAYARWDRLPEAVDTPTELSAREFEIAELVAQGLTSRQIAQRLQLSARTVDSHIEHAFKKLGLNSRTRLALWVSEQSASAAGGPRPAQ